MPGHFENGAWIEEPPEPKPFPFIKIYVCVRDDGSDMVHLIINGILRDGLSGAGPAHEYAKLCIGAIGKVTDAREKGERAELRAQLREYLKTHEVG